MQTMGCACRKGWRVAAAHVSLLMEGG